MNRYDILLRKKFPAKKSSDVFKDAKSINFSHCEKRSLKDNPCPHLFRTDSSPCRTGSIVGETTPCRYYTGKRKNPGQSLDEPIVQPTINYVHCTMAVTPTGSVAGCGHHYETDPSICRRGPCRYYIEPPPRSRGEI